MAHQFHIIINVKKCNHKWKVRTLGGLKESKYCPNCGTKQIENTKTKEWDF